MKMTGVREVEQQMRLDQEGCLRAGKICLKSKEDELVRRQEQLSLCEGDIKHYEKEHQACEASLNNKSDQKRDDMEPSYRCERKEKKASYTR